MKPRILASLLIALLLLVVGCQKEAPRPQTKQYDVTATVTAVGADKQTVTLDHKDIPGLMQAMEMEFKVESPQVLDGIHTGDEIQGRLEVRSGENIITNLKKR